MKEAKKDKRVSKVVSRKSRKRRLLRRATSMTSNAVEKPSEGV